MRTLVWVLLIVGVCVNSAISQIPKSPNKTDKLGKPDGQWTVLLDSGERVVQDTSRAYYYLLVKYDKGNPVGVAEEYYLTGELSWRGELITVVPFQPVDGKHVIYHKNGAIAQEFSYLHGKFSGAMVGYYSNGTKEFVDNYKDGVLDGEQFVYYESGKHQIHTFFVNGVRKGEMIIYYESGNKQSTTPHKDGKIEGVQIVYYENGNKQAEIPYVADKIEGVMTTYYMSGAKQNEFKFEDCTIYPRIKSWEDVK